MSSRMITHYYLLILLAVLIGLFCSGCKAEERLPDILIGGGSSTSIWYSISTTIADLVGGDFTASSEVTSGGVENCIRVGEGDFDFAFINNNASWLAQNGQWPFEKKYDNIYGVALLYFAPVQIVVFDKSDVGTIDDLRGRKVLLGPPGASTYMMAVDLLKAYGISLDDITGREMSYAEGAMAMRDNHYDAMVVIMPSPNSSIMDLSLKAPLRLLNIDRAKQIAAGSSYYKYAQFDSDIYSPGTSGVIETLSLGTMIICNSQVGQGKVYALLEAIFDNLDVVRDVHTAAQQISLETAIEMPIRLHPEAEQFFKDRAVLESATGFR